MSEQHDVNLEKARLEQNIQRVSDLESSDLIDLVHKQPTTKEKLSLIEELLKAFKLQSSRNMGNLISHPDKDATPREYVANLQSEFAYNNEIFGKKRDDFIKAIFYNKELFSALSEATLYECISYVGTKKLYEWVSTLQDNSFKEKIFLDIMKIFDNKKYGKTLSAKKESFVVQVLNNLNNKSMVQLLIKYITNHMRDKGFIKIIKDNVDRLYRRIHIENHHYILDNNRLKKSGIKSPFESQLLVLQELQTLLQDLITASDKQASSALPFIAATPNRSIVAATEASQKRSPGKTQR